MDIACLPFKEIITLVKILKNIWIAKYIIKFLVIIKATIIKTVEMTLKID